jgi:hypothetical protein
VASVYFALTGEGARIYFPTSLKYLGKPYGLRTVTAVGVFLFPPYEES